MDGSGIGVGLTLAGVIFAIVLLIAWIVLPFAIIGTKSILRDLLDETKKNNMLLQKLASQTSPVPHDRNEPVLRP